MRALITGCAGFMGSHLTKYILDHTDWEVVGLDRIDYAGNLNRLSEMEVTKNPKFKFVFHDFRAAFNDLLVSQIGYIDIIFHIGAASHVDRSIVDPIGYILDNVLGTGNVLEYARKLLNLKRFMYFSTDEVFGPLEEEPYYDLGQTTEPEIRKFTDWDRYNSQNPYSATKAGAEELCLAYENTFSLPIIITHCNNIYGEYQHPEKFIPKAIRFIENEDTLPIYADKTGKISGSREYVYTDTVSEALLFLVEHGEIGDKYNIAGEANKTNLEMAQMIANEMRMVLSHEMVASDNVRPGNDFAYGVDDSKLRGMGFTYKTDFSTNISRVIKWYLDNPQWYRLKG